MRRFFQRALIYLLMFIVSLPLSMAQTLDKSVEEKMNTYKEQAQTYQREGNSIQEAENYNKIAYLYWENGMLNQAIDYFSRSLEINKQINNQNGIKTIYYNIGLIYADKEEYQQAVENFRQGMEYARNLKQKGGIYTGLINQASALKNLSQHKQAVTILNEALSYAQELNNLKLVRTCYGMLAENYEALGDSENAMKYFDLFATVDKHVKAEQIKTIEEKSKEEIRKAEADKAQSQKELSERSSELEQTKQTLQQTKELTEKQKLELELNRLIISEKEAELRNKRLIIYGILLIFVVILFFSILVYRQFQAKKKANEKLAEQNVQIFKQKEEIEKQRDLANKQKMDITDSIEYAKRIQTALLPPLSFIRRSLPEHFILFKPRDIVSGDFYWMMNKDDKIIIAAADCTGHGVPGAFMSVLGTAFLNEIVNKIVENKHVYSLQAHEILNQLRSYIIESLHQSGADNESKDGIDIALCIIDPGKQKLQFAGAHNPLYLIRNNELQIIKGDRMPVSIHQKAHKSFTNHEIDFFKDDVMYIFSDGFVDQIGGPKKRKFMSRNFKELLLKIHEKPMDVQQQILEKTFEEWKGDYIQLDDILVIGIKLEKSNRKVITKDKYDWSDKTILIAEDTEMNYLFLVEALKTTDVNILRAQNGAEAIAVFKENPEIDLILMDINMPGMDGFETTQEIKKIRKNIPVIAQTALNNEDAKDKADEVGCDDIILKPIQLKLFLATLNKYLKS
jgi:CheY-like chemotaxis protein